jgi:hypothetical protein
MSIVKLIRVSSSEKGTFGNIIYNGKPLCVTLELPWRDNKPNISCIPMGTYEVVNFDSPSKGNVFLLKDVPNRSYIEIHVANFMSEIKGCIAVGMEFSDVGVAESAIAMKKLKRTLPDEFILEVHNALF